jgi:two-component system sensor kinase FixL
MIEFTALDELPVPLFRCGADGVIVYVNGAWTAEMDLAEGSRWNESLLDVDDARAAELWDQCVTQQRPVRLPELALKRGGATHWYTIILQPVVDDGQPQMLGSFVDVTEQTVALAETSAILDTAVDGIVIIDEQGTIQTFNQAASRLFGYEPEAVIGRSINMLMTEENRRNHDGYLRNYLATGEAQIIGVGRELVAKTATGDEVPIYLAVSDIRLDGRRRFAGIIRDLSEQNAAREALASQREKLAHVGRLSTMGEMTASIAHEINQPLTAISMYAQASLKLLDREDGREKVRDALEKLNTQSLRAGAVIERIQRFARAQETTREMVVPNELIVDLLKLAESDARMHDIQIELSLADDLPEVFADPVQLQQVVLNLIRNGIDAMNEIGCRNGRSIRLATRQTGDELEISVADQGPGVADDQLDLLFTPFHTTKKEGMGMGLSICRSIVTEHGGELRYRNNRETGATFYFTLPIDHE